MLDVRNNSCGYLTASLVSGLTAAVIQTLRVKSSRDIETSAFRETRDLLGSSGIRYDLSTLWENNIKVSE